MVTASSYNKKIWSWLTLRYLSGRSGDLVGLRGPYGNSYTFKKTYKKILIVGGGTGLVPLLRLASYARRLKIQSAVVIGARTKGEVFFENIAKKIIQDTDSSLKICTDDGSYGIRGTTVEVMSKVLHENTFDCVFTCGPELMMRKVAALSNDKSIPAQQES